MDVHRCRFVPYPPPAVNALAFSHPPDLAAHACGPHSLRLAVGRGNGDVEIWCPIVDGGNSSAGGFNWTRETVFRGGEGRSIEGLAWTRGPGRDGAGRLRLFSVGASSVVSEWDLGTGTVVRNSSGSFGEVWCLAAQPRAEDESDGSQLLAAGCADGSVVVLSTADEDLQYVRALRPSTGKTRSSKGRVLSVAFQNRHRLVAGYADNVLRVFDLRSGTLVRTVSLGAPESGPREALVWAVECLPDGTVVSGDSSGELKFWESRNYSLVQRVQGHLADVLALASSGDGRIVLSAGADARTVFYQRRGGTGARWAEVMHRRYHTHDVKALAVFETRDLSVAIAGGLDPAPVVLPLRDLGRALHRRLPQLPAQPQLASAPGPRLVLSWWDRQLRIDRVAARNEPYQTPMHRLVARLLLQGDENLTAATLTPDGRLLAAATASAVKLFELSTRQMRRGLNASLPVRKLPLPSVVEKGGARMLAFSPDKRWLLIVRPNSEMVMAGVTKIPSFQVREEVIELDRAERPGDDEESGLGRRYERTINAVAFAPDSQAVAVGDLAGYVDTWALRDVPPQEQAGGKDGRNKTDASADHTDNSDSDSDSDSDAPVVLDNQTWTPLLPIPKLPAPALILSFHPPPLPRPGFAATAANIAPLLAVTVAHHLLEFDPATARLTNWARRNPRATLPPAFLGVKDRAMGVVWDVGVTPAKKKERKEKAKKYEGNRKEEAGKEDEDSSKKTVRRPTFWLHDRLWVYGASWLFMFDFAKGDFGAKGDAMREEDAKEQAKEQEIKQEESDNPTTTMQDDGQAAATTNSDAADGDTTASKRRRERAKRKRASSITAAVTADADAVQNSGAGDAVPLDKSYVGIGRKMRKVMGTGRNAWVDEVVDLFGGDGQDGRGEHGDRERGALAEAALARLRRAGGIENDDEEDSDKMADHADNADANADAHAIKSNHNDPAAQPGAKSDDSNANAITPHLLPFPRARARAIWHTFAYRDILGVVPLSGSVFGLQKRPGRKEEREGAALKELQLGVRLGAGRLEVAVVERPRWEVEEGLPGRYVRDWEV